jgi:hypothetical protein
MKYIKPFNESFDNEKKIEELKDFCESNLVYLLDEDCKILYGYKDSDNKAISISSLKNGDKIVSNVAISLIKKYDDKYIKWVDIKDYYISFIERLLNNYELVFLTPRWQEDKYIQFIYKDTRYNGHFGLSYNYLKDITQLDQFDNVQFESISIIVKLKLK